MFHLIKLEIKKYKLYRYVLPAVICIIGVIAFLTMSFITTLVDSRQAMDTYENTLRMIQVIMTQIFIIFSAVLTTKIIMDEYKNRTILNMFTYPINRKEIIIAKLLVIVLFTMIAILIGDLVCTAYVMILDSFVNVVSGNFDLKYFLIGVLLTSVAMGGILSLIPFSIGIILKKSGVATLITSVIIAVVLQPIIIGNSSLLSTLIKLIIVLIIVWGISFYVLKNQINKIENNYVE